MLSVKPDRPVDPLTLAVLRAIAGITRELGLPYFVAGAMARDIVLTNVFGIDTGRATQDVDLAVAVENWDQFKIVKEKLIASGQFNAAEKAMHRLYYRANGGNTGYPLDILPFRGVEQPPSIIAWPPDMKVIMNVIGYEDGHTGYSREPRRWRRADRRRHCGEGVGGRLYPALLLDRHAGDEPAALQERAVRSDQGLRADHAARDHADTGGRDQQAPCRHPQGTRRCRQSGAGKDHVRVGRPRLGVASVGRDIQDSGRQLVQGIRSLYTQRIRKIWQGDQSDRRARRIMDSVAV